VKDKVEASWREDEIAKRLKDKAAQLLDKLKAGSTLAELAGADGLKVDTLAGLKRGSTLRPFSANAIDKLFVTPKNGAASAEGEQAGDQVVFRVTDIVVPKTDLKSDEAKSIAENLNRSLSEDVFTQYITQVQSEIGVTINRGAVSQVVTGNSNAPDDTPGDF
jgi:peptidyl-prolyl cis-trans isomerase D